jgi:hypothetical protein
MEEPQSAEINEASATKPDNEEQHEQVHDELDNSFKHDPDDSGDESEKEILEKKEIVTELSNDTAELANGLKTKLELNGDESATNGENEINGTDPDENREPYKQEEYHEEGHKTEGFATEVKKSQSNEFTYFSLTSNRPDDLDEAATPTDEPRSTEDKSKQQELRIESVNLTLVKESAAVTAKIADDTQSTKSDDSIKKLSFDALIDRVRGNTIANKDVCNYVLNLLVGGEFDLEKNFVIKNINSILNMIQVIKCARPALKVKIFIYFILKKFHSF